MKDKRKQNNPPSFDWPDIFKGSTIRIKPKRGGQIKITIPPAKVCEIK